MRRLTWLFVLACLSCPTLFAQEKNPVAVAIRRTLEGRSKSMVAAAEEMPDKMNCSAALHNPRCKYQWQVTGRVQWRPPSLATAPAQRAQIVQRERTRRFAAGPVAFPVRMGGSAEHGLNPRSPKVP
jgi:hypothetical protein